MPLRVCVFFPLTSLFDWTIRAFFLHIKSKKHFMMIELSRVDFCIRGDGTTIINSQL
jgi:hypothetical protein